MSAASEHDRLALLASIDEITEGGVLLGETVTRLLEFVVPAFADVATLDRVSPGGELRRIGSRVAGPGREELERALARRRPIAEAPAGLPRALASAESNLVADMTDETLRSIAADDEDFELLRALELRSAVFVPLRARGRTVGALACGVGTSGRRYGEADLRFAEVLSARLALALDNAGLSATVSGLEQRFEATLHNLAEAVVVNDASGQTLFANAAAARLLGVGSTEDVISAAPGELMALFDVYDERGHEIGLNDLPSVRAIRGETTRPLLVRNVIRATGEQRWLLHKATPVLDPGGSLAMVVSVIEDLTEVKRAELAQRLLAEAGQALSSSLEYEQALQDVAELAVPGLAEWCAVVMRGESDALELVAVAHADPGKAAAGRELAAEISAQLGGRAGTAAVIARRSVSVVPAVGEELLARIGVDRALGARALELRLGSLLIAPLAVAGQAPIGLIALAAGESGRRFDVSDLTLARELGHRAAIAVENARLYRERSQIATTLQRSLLPPDLPSIPGFRLAGSYQPAGEQNAVGGDFYDAFEVPGGWIVLVGDVAGHGAEAAALTSLSRYTLRTAGRLLGDAVAAVEQLNRALRETPALSLVSVCCVLLRVQASEASAELVLGGHPPAFHVRGGTPEPVGVFAPFLGAYDHGGWQAVSVQLDPGDRLVLYTDGVIDAVGRQERFGEERLAAILHGERSAADTVARIEAAVHGFAVGPQADDIAVVVVERTRGG